jgi:hypothetical protein
LLEGGASGFPVLGGDRFDFAPKEVGAGAFGFTHQSLRVIFQLLYLSLLARVRIYGGAQLGGRFAGPPQLVCRGAECAQEGQEGAVGDRPGEHAFGPADECESVERLRVAGLEERPRPFELGFDCRVVRRGDAARRGFPSAGARLRRAVNFRRGAVFNNQGARGDEGGDLGVAELAQ